MGKCEIRWCNQNGVTLVYVDEIIGDGSWRVGICYKCARRLGLKEGDDLPSANIVKKRIQTKS